MEHPAPTPAVDKPRILVVEDEVIVARDICQQLTEQGYEAVAHTPHAEAAIELAEKLHPDLVLMDVSLAGAMDGITAAREIRERFAVPVVFLTAFTSRETLDRAKEVEPFGYIIKPFSEQELRTAIEIALYKNRAEARLRGSEARYRALTESANDAIVTTDRTGQIVGWNRGATRLFGYPEAEVFGQPVTLLTPDRFRGDHADHMARADSGGTHRIIGRSVELTGRRKDGSEMPIELSLSQWETAEGHFVTSIIRDITERQRAKVALEESEKQFRAMFDLASIGMCQADVRTGRWLRVNRKFSEITGYPVDELLRIGNADITHPDDRQKDWDGFQQVVRGAAPEYHIEKRYIRKDGAVIWVRVNMTVLRDAAGEPLRSMATIEDITARRQAAETLRISEERFRSILQSVQFVAVQGYAPDGATQYWNKASEVLYGYTAEEAIGRNLLDLIIPDEMREGVRQAMQAMAATGEPVPAGELPMQRKDGARVTVFSSHTIIKMPGRPQELFCVDIDLTERKRSEARLRLQGGALDAAANAIVITNRAGTIEWVNAAFTTFSGHTAAEAIGKSPGQLLRSGKQDPAFFKAMWETILAGEVWNGEIINRHKDGHLYTEEMTITPIRDEHGTITQFIAVKQDITKRKALEEQFRQAQKMEAIGQLAGGVAHDFNNILAAVMMYLGLLQDEPTLTPTIRSSLKELSREIQRGAVLTRQLLAFSRQQAMESTRLDLATIVSGLIKMLSRLLGENIKILVERDPAVAAVEADAGMMEQVVINLCINARDAMPRGGSLTLRTETIAVAPGSSAEPSGVRPGRFVRLSVTDTGDGMSAETLQHIFEPFFTTKAVGKGTGLGLATVYGIVQQHGGWVTVESVLGQGTSFHVHLPASSEVATCAPAPGAPLAPAKGGSETILLVEDEPSLRTIVALMLRHHGYHVIEASDGHEAMRLWKQHSAAISLLFTDLVMPNGLSGQELIARLRALRPTLKVIACTGYNKHLTTSQFPPESGIILLRKPFDSTEARVAVRACLDQS
jgi:PAS domain S-box-containing protein